MRGTNNISYRIQRLVLSVSNIHKFKPRELKKLKNLKLINNWVSVDRKSDF